uniref:Uncharacterized protein n=1 Tax=Arundo donax TaxID=35708 RepID=A0A0A9G7G3_ARUDO
MTIRGFLVPHIQNYYKILDLAKPTIWMVKKKRDRNHMWMAFAKVCKQASLRASLTVGCA